MEPIKKKPIRIVETALRDAHQSLMATRMSTEQMPGDENRGNILLL